MVKNIIFDIGNVLVKFDPLAYLALEYEDFETVMTFFLEVFESEEWSLLDAGLIDDDEAVRRVSKRLPEHRETVEKFIKTWEYFLIEEMKASTYFLKLFKEKGYKVYALSNYPERSFLYTETKYDFFKLFDGKVISYEVKKIKPDLGIYNTLFEKYSLNPEECIFIDDTYANVEAARELGMKAVHFRQTEQFLEVLDIIEGK
ncbi:MAG: HAD family phosphatase [Clostridiaceae bacterium]